MEKENNSKQCLLDRVDWQNLKSGLKTILNFNHKLTSITFFPALKEGFSNFNESFNLVAKEYNRLVTLIISFFTF